MPKTIKDLLNNPKVSAFETDVITTRSATNNAQKEEMALLEERFEEGLIKIENNEQLRRQIVESESQIRTNSTSEEDQERRNITQNREKELLGILENTTADNLAKFASISTNKTNRHR